MLAGRPADQCASRPAGRPWKKSLLLLLLLLLRRRRLLLLLELLLLLLLLDYDYDYDYNYYYDDYYYYLRKRRVGSRTPLDFSPHSRGCQASCALHLEPKTKRRALSA